MWENFERFWEKEKHQSNKREVTSYLPWKLDFIKQEKKDKEEADTLLIQITWENTSKWNHKERGSQQKITTNTLRNMPRWKIDENTLWSVQNIMDHHNIQQREDEYLAQHETMSESEYNTLFSWKERLQQWLQFWDCYLVSWINELAMAQQFDTLIRTSMRRIKWKDESGFGYEIKIPLWEPSWRKILIKDSELSIAKINWNKWYKFLELAYAKNRLRKNDKLGNKYRPITAEEFSWIKWWWTKEVLETFIWKHNISFNTFGDERRSKPLSRISEREKAEITWFLNNYIPSIGNKFLSLSSLSWNDRNWYRVWDSTIYYWHAYSITWINKEKWKIKSITILNPRNNNLGPWKQYQDITIDELLNWFSYMSCGTINRQTFLDNKSMS